ncbi:hypothetical protein ACFU93_26430 [Streptomyces sp. NPDC057611]|uniref:hypothetical protein n=1 Tax=Streptomyces sp. NPDC057611 TaxID=3346182 RepID=UPI00367ACA65
MDIAALITWVVTALGGFYLLVPGSDAAESVSSNPVPAACPHLSSSGTSPWPRSA